jgi:DNA-binding MarR family transcriptional regulator
MTFDFERAIAFWINRVGFLIRKELRRRFLEKDLDITPEEWAVLMQLWQRDGQASGELADKTIRDRTTVTRLLDGMVRKGLVQREPDNADRRLVRIHLSRNGQRLEHDLVPIAQELIRDMVVGIPESDVETAIGTLRRMQENLLLERE